MSDPKEAITNSTVTLRERLEERLQQVDRQFRDEMRARGFDPEQDENQALTAPLAALYTEREQLREKLASAGETL